ncbi:AAA family ATPase [Streptomyces sp. NBC_01476]|uniref:AAA family ATPase n=1 Tax=Streptomyces sp. NBC_01476 TaxID=2903881 RepID=UPI002E31EA34|nr:AAA family ATPase [Streptomyces sp. NBC_01476]
MRGSPYPQARDALLATAGEALAAGTGVLLTGEPGIGRSTLFARLAAEQAAAGRRLLSCHPARDEQRLPYLGLIDLFAAIDDAFLTGPAHLTPAELTALHTALHRAPTPYHTPERPPTGPRPDALPPAPGNAATSRHDPEPVATGPRPEAVPRPDAGPPAPGNAGGTATAPHHDPEPPVPTGVRAVAGSVGGRAAEVASGWGATRDPGAADGRGELVLHLGVLKTLTALCAEGPLMVAVDDAHWLDPPTARALAFAVRRMRGLPLTVLATARTPEGELPLAGRAVRVVVPPMSEREITALVAAAEPGPRQRASTVRIAQCAAGNPAIALELARATATADPGDPLPLPPSVRTLLLDRQEPLSDRARHTLLTAAAADRPSTRLLRRAGCDQAAADLAEAAAAGIVETPQRGLVRFTHPLMPRALYDAAGPEARGRVHAALAEAAEDPVERAHHLASLTPGWDERTAAVLAEAAALARRRGDPAVAARLGGFAADRTPPDDPAADAERRLTAAEDAVAAGDYPLARRIAHDVLAGSERPAERVRAWMVIVDTCGQALAEVADVFPQALQDARDDPELLARLHLRLGWRARLVEGSAPNAHTHAARSAVLARRAGDRRTELLALTQQSSLEFYLGDPAAERTLALALTAPHDPQVLFDHNGPVYLKHRSHLLNDRLDDARTELRALIYTVRHRGSAESLCQCLSGLAQVEILRGRCERALDLAHQSLRVTEQAGLSEGPSWYAVALAEAAGGSPDRALAAAERARRHSEDDDDRLFLPRALHAEGHIRLLRGETAAAVDALQRTRLLELGQGQGDPAIRRWQADLAEALVAAGCADEAAALLTETRAQAVRLGRRGILAVLDRSAALVAEARGDREGAVAGLERAAAEAAALPYRLEEGRTRLTLGRVRARCGDERGARAALAEAARVFTRAGARPWLALATAELDRVEVRPAVPAAPGLTALTSTERRVALLVAQGATNRETATMLTVSVKTVEAALTRAYRKLGVRSRTTLSRALFQNGNPTLDVP